MAQPHPYGEAVVALFLSSAPLLGVAGLLVGERLERSRRRAKRPPEPGLPGLPRLEAVAGTE